MSENSAVNSVDEEDDGLFYFESDHLALKGNRDYSEMLKTIVLLQAQCAKAIQDYEKIAEIEIEALSKPNLFYKKIMRGSDLGIPDLQVIVEVPTIDWSKYPVELPSEALKFLNSEPSEEKVRTESPVKNTPEKEKSHSTYKKTWSVEEQRRLEELLAIYPPEPIELQRYKKIAAALGNRTVKQVSSRVQKYFLKLYKAGLPIPGRIPKNAEKAKKSKLHTHQRHNHLLFKPSTFFPQLDIPVVMNEAEVVPGPSADVTSSTNTSYHNYLLPNSENMKVPHVVEESKNNVELQIEILRRVKLEKEKESCNDYPVTHIGYRCNYCGEEPILGTRWHCEICTSDSVDFCCDCVVAQMYSRETHPLSHHLQPYSSETKMNSSTSQSSSEEDINGSNKNHSSGNDSSTSDDDDDDNETGNRKFDSATNELEEMDYDQDDSKTEDSSNHFSNFEQNSEESFPTIIDPGIDQRTSFSNSQYSNEFSYSKDSEDPSYTYLHSNLLLDD